jgi:hypothetical protein
MTKTTHAAGALLLAGSLAAHTLPAQEPSYDFIEFRYAETEIEVDGFPDVDGDGYQLGGSFSLSPDAHVFVDYENLEFDENVEASGYEIGLGYQIPVGRSTDLIMSIAYVDAEVETPFADFNDDGYALGAGFRGFLSESIELRGGANYVDLDRSGDDTSLELGADFYLNESFSVGPELIVTDETTTWTLGARFYF